MSVLVMASVLVVQVTGASPATTPLDAVRDVYALEKDALELRGPHAQEYRSRIEERYCPKLRALLVADRECSRRNKSICNLDWDPLMGGNDFDEDWLTTLKLKQTMRRGRTARVRASYEGPPETTTNIDFDLSFQGSRWCIADVRTRGLSLAKTLNRPVEGDGKAESGRHFDVREVARDLVEAIRTRNTARILALIAPQGLTCSDDQVPREALAKALGSGCDFHAFFFSAEELGTCGNDIRTHSALDVASAPDATTDVTARAVQLGGYTVALRSKTLATEYFFDLAATADGWSLVGVDWCN
ncbi:MAG: DUF3828 domain-containing protein [Anaeromyxobacteraceae bacterium]